jgi:hypothetical protein
MAAMRAAEDLRAARVQRRIDDRNRRDAARAKAVASVMGVDWSSLDDAGVKKWLHMAHEMTHLRLDGRWNNTLLIANRMALQVDATEVERKALRSVSESLGHMSGEQLFFIGLGSARQMAWYAAALAVEEIFPSPSDRTRRVAP